MVFDSLCISSALRHVPGFLLCAGKEHGRTLDAASSKISPLTGVEMEMDITPVKSNCQDSLPNIFYKFEMHQSILVHSKAACEHTLM